MNQSYLPPENNNFEDFGLISIMYHRFNEKKYPSTNIQLDVFKKQLEVIENAGIQFIHLIIFLAKASCKKGKKDFINDRRWIVILL